ncbi:MAG: hypothetical protein ACOVOR_00050, partial [Rhabdochlamydiaceae bacterium]
MSISLNNSSHESDWLQVTINLSPLLGSGLIFIFKKYSLGHTCLSISFLSSVYLSHKIFLSPEPSFYKERLISHKGRGEIDEDLQLERITHLFVAFTFQFLALMMYSVNNYYVAGASYLFAGTLFNSAFSHFLPLCTSSAIHPDCTQKPVDQDSLELMKRRLKKEELNRFVLLPNQNKKNCAINNLLHIILAYEPSDTKLEMIKSIRDSKTDLKKLETIIENIRKTWENQNIIGEQNTFDFQKAIGSFYRNDQFTYHILTTDEILTDQVSTPLIFLELLHNQIPLNNIKIDGYESIG